VSVTECVVLFSPHSLLRALRAPVQLAKDERDGPDATGYFKPLQTIFGLKEHNAGKLDSHLWFFNAFAEQVITTNRLSQPLTCGSSTPSPSR
jgi:cellulose synthase/poly-beta-1,6-N-acetylglucosamine synthase-like glycosyltransferase